MRSTRLPWKLRGSDFNEPGWSTRPTIGYELFFEFLRLSPSYELARKAAVEGLTEQERAAVPVDFGLVQDTFAMLGDVQTTLFRQWWLSKGLHAFGNPHARPVVHELFELRGGADVALPAVQEKLDTFLGSTRRDEGLAPGLLLSVPLGQRKSDVLRQLSRLLDKYAEVSGITQPPKLTLMGQRLRAKVLFNGVRLLWFKAAKPKWELWRLGAKARLSKTYSEVLDVTAPRKVKDEFEMRDREMMSKITYRALVKFEAIAENAARGRFPSEGPVEQMPFDYPALARRIRRKNLWEDKEKARLLKAYKEEQKARRTVAAEPL